MKKNLYFNADTIIAFRMYGGGGNNNRIECLGEHKISDFIGDLFSPVKSELDENGNLVDDTDPDAEWTAENGNGVELTNAMVASGVGRIDIDGYYDTIYTKKLSDIEYTDREALAMVNGSYGFVSDQAVLYFIEGETRDNAEAILEELGLDADKWLDNCEE